jgi:hypothetical protein
MPPSSTSRARQLDSEEEIMRNGVWLLATLCLIGAVHVSQTALAAGPWTRIGGSNINPYVPPVAKTRVDSGNFPTNLVDIYVMGNDGTLSVATLDTTRFTTTWQTVGCCLQQSMPAVVTYPDYRHIFGIGNDNKLYHNWSVDGAAWSGYYWFNIPGQTTIAPPVSAAARMINGNVLYVDVYAASWNTSELQHVQAHNGWTWENLGGSVSYPVVVTDESSNGTSAIDVFYYNYYDGHIWDYTKNSSYTDTGFINTNLVTAAFSASGEGTVFAMLDYSPYNVWAKTHVTWPQPPFWRATTHNGSAPPYIAPTAVQGAGSLVFLYYYDSSTELISRFAYNTSTYQFVPVATHTNTKLFYASPGGAVLGFPQRNMDVLFAVDPNAGDLWFFVDTPDGT